MRWVKPVVQLLTCPLIVVTLGLFTLIINALMMALTSWFADVFDIGFNVDRLHRRLHGRDCRSRLSAGC